MRMGLVEDVDTKAIEDLEKALLEKGYPKKLQQTIIQFYVKP